MICGAVEIVQYDERGHYLYSERESGLDLVGAGYNFFAYRGAIQIDISPCTGGTVTIEAK